MITYKKIEKSQKQKLEELQKRVLDSLQRKDFFNPFSEEKKQSMFNTNKIIAYGAYEEENLIATAQLYIDKSYIEEIKEYINVETDKVAKIGGYLVEENYRNRGIIKKLEKILIDEAKRLGYKYIVVIVHPENIPSIKVISYTGAKLIKTITLGKYLRSIYLLEL